MKKNTQTQWCLLTVLTALALTIAAGPAACQGSASAVSLRLEREKVSDGIRFWLTGSVNPFKAGYTGQTVALSVVGPQGQLLFDENLTLDLQGSFRHEFHFQRDLTDSRFHLRGPSFAAGLYAVYVSYGSASCEALIPVLPPIGSAIIVAGYGEQTCNRITGRHEDLQQSVNALAEDAYTVLRTSLGLPRDRIYFLHPDLAVDCDLDGQPDVDALPTPENLRFAIENWALEKFCTTEPEGIWHNPLTVYIVSGSGGSDVFYLNQDDPVCADNLAYWLSTLKAGIDRRQFDAGVSVSPLLQATVILESPMSGSFISDLAGPNTGLTVLTSSADPMFAHCESHVTDAGGVLSFSHRFWNRIRLGESVGGAWTEAAQFILSRYDDQYPQLAADGNYLPTELSDELLVSERYLQSSQTSQFSICGEACCATGEGTFRPVRLCVVGESVHLRADVRHASSAQGCTVDIVAFPPAGLIKPNMILELTYSDELQSYVGALPDGFAAPGEWELLYIAVDVDGHVAVTSHKLMLIAANIDADMPAPSYDDLTWPGTFANLQEVLAATNASDSNPVADLINNKARRRIRPTVPGQHGPLVVCQY